MSGKRSKTGSSKTQVVSPQAPTSRAPLQVSPKTPHPQAPTTTSRAPLQVSPKAPTPLQAQPLSFASIVKQPQTSSFLPKPPKKHFVVQRVYNPVGEDFNFEENDDTGNVYERRILICHCSLFKNPGDDCVSANAVKEEDNSLRDLLRAEQGDWGLVFRSNDACFDAVEKYPHMKQVPSPFL